MRSLTQLYVIAYTVTYCINNYNERLVLLYDSGSQPGRNFHFIVTYSV